MMDEDDYRREMNLFEEQFALEQALRTQAAKAYLGKYGDAVERRMLELRDQAQQLHKLQHFGPCITVTVTAIEVLISHFFVRPLLLNFAFEGEVQEKILDELAGPRSQSLSRKILPDLLRSFGIDLKLIKLKSGAEFLPEIQRLITRRNDFVHRGDLVDLNQADLALECLESFVSSIIPALRAQLEMPENGPWDPYHNCDLDLRRKFGPPFPESPFK